MPIADRHIIDHPVALRVSSDQVASGGDAIDGLLVLVVFLLLPPVRLRDFLPTALHADAGGGDRTGGTLLQHERFEVRSV